MNRFFLFLYSTPNLVGVVLALVGLSLFFLGLIDRFWFFIVAGLYGIGYLVAPKNRPEDLRIRQQLSLEEVEGELNALVRTVRRRAPPSVLEHVESIADSIKAVLPRILDLDTSLDKNVYTIRRTALEYLPETLEHYFALPTVYRRTHPVKDGKTAQDLLLAQLELLDAQMKEIVSDFNRDDTSKLLAHGRFLEEKFGKSDWFV